MWSNLSLIWKMQLIGWTLFIAITFPTKLVVAGNFRNAIGSAVFRDGFSFVLTLLMREFYRRMYRRHKDPSWIIGASLVASAIAAILQLPAFCLFSGIFPYEEKTIFGQYVVPGILTFRGGQFEVARQNGARKIVSFWKVSEV